ncbi:uncharacterized protein TNCV_4313391 [Trichonephila clavipes]|nr:uncharacterized protein TNCV_4313391 [Trichonephila clavipes]
MSVGCLVLIIIEEIGEILKWCVDRVMVEMIIGVTTRIAAKEISGSRPGIDFRRMIEDLTIEDINLEMEVKKDDFSRGDHRKRGSSENISGGDTGKRGRLNVLKLSTDLTCIAALHGVDFDRKSLAIQDSQVEDIKVDEGNLRVDVSETKLNVVTNFSVKKIQLKVHIIGEKVNCAIIRDLVISSREQLIEEQRTDPELGHIYRYLENPEDRAVNVTICENWSHDLKLIEGLLFYAKYATSLEEMRVYIPKFLRNEIMREFHDKPLTGHFGRF